MATLSAVVIPAKVLKGGKHKVRISVAHNGCTRYVLTNIIIDSLSEFNNGQVVKRPDASRLNTKLRHLIQQYQDAIDEMPYVNSFTCPELIQALQSSPKQHTLKSLFEEMLANSSVKESTKETYLWQFSALSRHLDTTIRIEAVNHFYVTRFFSSLSKANYSNSHIANLVALFRAILRYGNRNGYVSYKIDPFINIKVPQPEIRDVWLTVEELKKLRDAPLTKSAATTRDFLMLSYYLGGINITDLRKINFKKNMDRIRYCRQKTERLQKMNKYVEFDIPAEAKPLIAKYMDKDGFIIAKNIPNRFIRFSSLMNMGRIVYYTARKSFSQHAYELGVNTSVIDYILGHKVGSRNTHSCLYAYIKVTPEMATEAIRKVLDNLK